MIARVIACSLFAVVAVLVSSAQAQDYIVIDGFLGTRGRWMQPEVERLRSSGHQVSYVPWWGWRKAVRTNGQQPVNVIGYSLGGSRAVKAVHHLNVNQLELLDPVAARWKTLRVPNQIPTVVYRATESRFIQSSPVVGWTNTIYIPTNHGNIPSYFRGY